MISELLKKEKEYINYFFDHINVEEIEKAYAMVQNCRGLIALTGVGKSGLTAKKIAATMTSTNTRAIFLSPVNALHGDLGIISAEDVFIFLSKSGESDELMALIPALRNKGVSLIAIVSNPKSTLAKACDLTVTLPVKKELCPFDMVPTTSSIVQLLFGDLLAVGLMMERKLSLDEYALNHPAGRIGKTITLKVRDLMIVGNAIPLASPEDLLVDTLVELSNKRCGCVLITSIENKLLGIFTDGDLRRSLQERGGSALNMALSELMTENPRQISPDILAVDAIKAMESFNRQEITVLPVTESDNRIVGLIKLHDIIQTGI